jgi:hypothetical protein
MLIEVLDFVRSYAQAAETFAPSQSVWTVKESARGVRASARRPSCY